MTTWWETPEFKAEVARDQELLAEALTRQNIPPQCRLSVSDGGKRWVLQGGGCENVWFDEPSQAEIDKVSWWCRSRNSTGGHTFRSKDDDRR